MNDTNGYPAGSLALVCMDDALVDMRASLAVCQPKDNSI